MGVCLGGCVCGGGRGAGGICCHIWSEKLLGSFQTKRNVTDIQLQALKVYFNLDDYQFLLLVSKYINIFSLGFFYQMNERIERNKNCPTFRPLSCHPTTPCSPKSLPIIPWFIQVHKLYKWGALYLDRAFDVVLIRGTHLCKVKDRNVIFSCRPFY